MGNRESIVDINSDCNWIPDDLVEDQIRRIESFQSNYEIESQLFDNLSQKIANIDGVSSVIIDNPRKRWFRKRTITVSINPHNKIFHIKGRAISSPFIGLKAAVQGTNQQYSTEIGTILYPTVFGNSIFIKQIFPLLNFIDLEKTNPIPHVTLQAHFSGYPICDEKYKTQSFNLTFKPSNEDYKISAFGYLRSSTKNDEILPFTDYFACGLSGYHNLMKDSRITNEDVRQLALKIKQKASAYCIWGGDDSLTPAIKYNLHIAGKVPPNIILRADAGTILSPQALPLPERFLLGNTTTLRSIGPQQFTNKYGERRVGCEHYLTLGCDVRIPLIPQENLDLMIFSNFGIGVKLNPSKIDFNVDDKVPSFVHIASLGFGLTLTQWKVNFETTFSIPINYSYGLEPLRYQITLTDNDL